MTSRKVAAANPFNPGFACPLWDSEVLMASVHLEADLLSCHGFSPSLILGSHLHLGTNPQLPGTDLDTHTEVHHFIPGRLEPSTMG